MVPPLNFVTLNENALDQPHTSDGLVQKETAPGNHGISCSNHPTFELMWIQTNKLTFTVNSFDLKDFYDGFKKLKNKP